MTKRRVLLTRNHRGRSLYRSKVGTWARGRCIRTPRSQSRPSRIPSGIAGSSIFPGQGRSHLKEWRERSLIAGANNSSKARVAAGLLAALHSYNRPALTAEIRPISSAYAPSRLNPPVFFHFARRQREQNAEIQRRACDISVRKKPRDVKW